MYLSSEKIEIRAIGVESKDSRNTLICRQGKKAWIRCNGDHFELYCQGLGITQWVDWERIVSAIEKLWKEPWKEVSGRHGEPGRELAMLIAQRDGGMSLREVGEAIGGLKYPAVNDSVRRTSARLETDRALEKKFKKLGKILKL